MYCLYQSQICLSGQVTSFVICVVHKEGPGHNDVGRVSVSTDMKTCIQFLSTWLRHSLVAANTNPWLDRRNLQDTPCISISTWSTVVNIRTKRLRIMFAFHTIHRVSLHGIHQLLFVMEIVLTVTVGTEFLNRVQLQQTSGFFNGSQLSGSRLQTFSTAHTKVHPAGHHYHSDPPRNFSLSKICMHSLSPRCCPNAQPIYQANPTIRTLPHDPIHHQTYSTCF
jgi:hypothetical protein